MEAARDIMAKMNQDERERYLYLRREMAYSDEISRIRTAENQGKQQGIRALIETCRDFGASREETLSKVAEKFSLSSADAEKHMREFWK